MADVTSSVNGVAADDAVGGEGTLGSSAYPFVGPGDMRAHCRALDWAATPAGPVEQWPSSLRTVVRLCLDSGFPMCVFIGPELVLVYNDSYRRALGASKHPAALGRPAREVWAEIWQQLVHELVQVLGEGTPVSREDQRFVIERGGRLEETFWTYAFSPVRDEGGAVVAVHNVANETTARVRAEAATREREAVAAQQLAQLEAIYRDAPVGLAVLDRDLRYLRINDRLAEINGIPASAHVGRTVREIVPAIADEVEALGRRVLDTGEPITDVPLSGETVAQPGVVRHFVEQWYPLRDADGAIIGINVVIEEVTERLRAEADRDRLLAESEAARARVTAVLESISDAFYAVDAEFRFTYVNRRAEALWGRRREELVGRHYWTEFPRAVGSESYRMHQQVMAERQPVHYETVSPLLGRWIEVNLYPEAGGGLACYFRDIAARKAAEAERQRLLAALEVERSRLATIFAQTPSILALVGGPEHVFELANEAYLQLIGHRDVIGRPLLEAVPELRGQGFERLLDGVLATGEPYVGREVSTWVVRAPGTAPEERFFDFVYLPRIEADGSGGTRITGVIAHGTDVTEQVRARREVERLLGESERARAEAEAARAEAEAANRAKAEFLAVMSHELRTPLNAIGGYAELMEMGIRGPVSDQQRADLARIQQSQRHLLGLINEVLNYARLETGSVRYDVADVPVRDVLAGAEALVSPQAHAKHIALTVAPCPATLAVRADAEKLRQILVNLLSNAVKFTDRGGRVELACDPLERDVLILVRDTGIGIAADQLERIFEPFVQVRADLTRTAEGTGLGLAISRDLARGMGGDLTAESTPGVGSVFTLTLPRAGRS